MHHDYFQRLWFMALACLLVTGCTIGPDPDRLAAATRLTRALGLGLNTTLIIEQELKRLSTDEPDKAGLLMQAYAEITPAAIENAAAPVYARYLTEEELNEMADFAESRAGQLFVRSALHEELSGQATNNDAIMRKLNVDDLTIAARFGQSDALKAYSRQAPKIKSDLRDAYRELYMSKLRSYLKQDPSQRN